jgi:prepilin-type N-terminal cleavage/methylation domain-containing protein
MGHDHRSIRQLAPRRGFTIIELLVVIVVIGILAGIGIVTFGTTKKKAYAAAMKSDLRNLVAAEEAYFSDSSTYVTYGDTSKLAFRSSAGVSAPTIAVGTGYWSATVTHSQVSNFVCGIAVKAANPVMADAGNGEPACR